jgi:hypothetical protein
MPFSQGASVLDPPAKRQKSDWLGSEYAQRTEVRRPFDDTEGVNRDKWKSIQVKVLEWMRDPAILGNDEFDPPSQAVYVWALSLLSRIIAGGPEIPAPDRVIPTGDGGLAFVKRMGSMQHTCEILPEGQIHYYGMVAGRMIYNHNMSIVQ